MVGGKGEGQQSLMPRIYVTLPPEIYRTLERITREKKFSLVWVMRDAAEKYIAERWPLFN